MTSSVAYFYGVVVLAVGIGLLGYTYWVYPWLVRLLPDRVPARIPDARQHAGVSVVIAARMPGPSIATKVRGVFEQAGGKVDEVVVVLDGPDGAARDALRSIQRERVEVVELPDSRGKAAALNAGVRRARGDVLVMTDARQRISPGAIARLLDLLVSRDVGAVSGALEIRRPDGRATLLDWYWERELALRDAEARWDSAVGVSGALYAIKREHWRDLPNGLLLDDLAVAMNVVRAGARVTIARDATVEDVPVGSDRTEFARKVRTLTGNFQYIAWHGWVLLPWHNRIWWQFLSHKVLRLLTPLAVVCVVSGVATLCYRFAPASMILFGLFVVLLLLASRLRIPVALSIARTLRSGMMLNGALVVATVNAFRGRWDVWQDPARPAFGPER